MDNYHKPWLNYKSDEADKEYPEPIRTKRNYKQALFWLIVGGWGGAHRFYLYDEKLAWKIFGGYFVLITLASFLKPFLQAAPSIVFVCYAIPIIYTSYPTLKRDVERVNQEIKND